MKYKFQCSYAYNCTEECWHKIPHEWDDNFCNGNFCGAYQIKVTCDLIVDDFIEEKEMLI